jgi:hypothetical protein
MRGTRHEEEHIRFMWRYRSYFVLVSQTLQSKRAEVDVFDDSRVEVSRFGGDGSVEGGEELVMRLLSDRKGNR